MTAVEMEALPGVDAQLVLAMTDRIIPTSAGRAVDRFRPGGPAGYRDAGNPAAPVRASRVEAQADWLRRVEGWA